uniref:Adenosine kinase n=1 Tax=Oncorhynchus tshawytscha TaxID=74940 RepID=A0AAZ3RXE5_ONCTS
MNHCIYVQNVVSSLPKCWMIQKPNEVTQEPIGTCAAYMTSDRSLVYGLSVQDNWELAENTKVYYIASFFLTVSLESNLKVAKHTSENNKIFGLNLLVMLYVNLGREMETFRQEISRRAQSLPKVNKKRQRVLVFTQGPPSIIATSFSMGEKVTVFPVLSVNRSDIVDTNREGDAFIGGTVRYNLTLLAEFGCSSPSFIPPTQLFLFQLMIGFQPTWKQEMRGSTTWF